MKVFKKEGKDAELAKTAPNTPEDEPGVTVVANEIDPSRELLSASVLEQIRSDLHGEHRSSPLRGDHRSNSSTSAMLREEKKEEDAVVTGQQAPGDVVSKTLNFFDDFCNLPVSEIANDNGVQAIAASQIKKHPYLLSHNAAFDDTTTSPSLPSETTGNSSSYPYSRETTSTNQKKKSSLSGAHNHENFEVVLDPASIIKEVRANSSSKHTRGNRLKNMSKSFKKKKNPHGPSNDDGTGAMQLKVPPARMEKVDEAPLDEEYGRLLGTNTNESEQFQNDVEGNVEDDHNHGDGRSSTSAGGPKVLAKKIWKNFKKTPQSQQPTKSDSAEVVPSSFEGRKSLKEQVFSQSSPKQDMEPILEEGEDEDDGNNGGNDKSKPSVVKALNSMFAFAGSEKPADKLLDLNKKPEPIDSSISESEEQKHLRMLEAMVPMRQSVEVVNKKPSHRGNTSLGRRLKKIQKSAYFTSGKKGAKKNKASYPSKPVASSQRSAIKKGGNANSDEVPRKPKQVWKSVEDPNTGRIYYYHRKTRETTWAKPEALKRYEVAYQNWLDATANASNANETPIKETKKETNDEEKASTRSPSIPKGVSSDDVENNEEANGATIVRTSTPAEGEKKRFQIQNDLVKEKKEDAIRVIAGESNNGEKAAEEETKARTDKKQPIDETEPFDEATPFDEPLAESNGPGLLFLPRTPPRFGRNMTYMSKASARSALTDRTEKVRNTGKGKFSSFNPISENAATSKAINKSHRVPSRVPVHRERQLMVEELTDARLSAESYESNAGEKRGRIVRGRAREIEPKSEILYDGDNDTDDYGTSTYDNDTYGTDSVSALSENDTDFLSRKDNFDQARRRALDAAIEIEDWDLAAALSDGMRATNIPGGYEKALSSWNQSELDKFIANNDWNAVKSYIARMREQSKKEQTNAVRLPKAPPVNKRVGSQSQIQHRDVMSESSWSGSDSQSSYDDETYDSESEI